MGLFSIPSLALKWSYLFGVSSVIVVVEFTNLYMKQLGFSPAQIGLSSLMGVEHIFLPLFGIIGDRFRARKLVLIVLTPILFLTTVAPLLPLVVSFSTCFVNHNESSMNETIDVSKESFQSAIDILHNVSMNRSSNPFHQTLSSNGNSTPLEEFKRNNYVPWLSTLFVFMAIIKVTFTVVERAFLSLQNVATITYLKEDRASYGSYFMWGHIGASVSLFAIGVMAAHIKINICGFLSDGYYIAFVWAAVGTILCSLALPWFQYEYIEQRVINWTEVKTIASDFHYAFVLIIAFYLGSCTVFQMNWEFWYINELHGSPTIIGVAGLIRRPLVALWFYLSGYLIEKIGDLKTIASALFLFFVAFLVISFINIPWLVLTVDLLQAAAYGFSYTALTVHCSKAGSKASSAVILGILEMVYAIGVDVGSGVLGLLFGAIGAKSTLFYYSITTAIILVGFLAYIYFAKDLDEYEKLPAEDSETD